MTQEYIPERVLVIAAHPDDIEFSSAGTIANWVIKGAKAAYVLCTSGDVGIAAPGMTCEKAARIREEESLNAARAIGVEEVIFLHHPDGLLMPTLELRKELVREIRKFKPEVVLTFDPTVVWGGDDYINHPDHRAAGQAALDATFPAAGQPNLFEELEEEGITAHKPRKVYVHAWEGHNVQVCLDKTIDLKIKALREHKSQMKDWDPEPMIREWAKESVGDGSMEYAENYRVITLVNDEDWEKSKGDPFKLI
ncbi:MAG: PIG-L family deacetylase [Anaerolineales bacterium]|nr:PIG-L family deacetylase [Anaerolineales bacterium]